MFAPGEVVASGAGALEASEPVEAAPSHATIVHSREHRSVHEGLGFRIGLLGHGLFDSLQGRPFVYPDFGMRYKHGDLYFDLKAPLWIALLDLGQYLAQQEIFGVAEPLNLAQGLNGIEQMMFLEIAHARLGQRFAFAPFDDAPPLDLAVGVMASVEWLVIDSLVRDDIRTFEDPSLNFPVLLMPGAFVSLGSQAPRTRYDVAIGVGKDILGSNDNYDTDMSPWVVSLDVDVQIAILPDLAAYLRTRFATYTHDVDPWVVTMAFGSGVIFRLW